MSPLRCPFCSKSGVHRSRRKDLIEKVFCAVIGVRPFRCEDCEARFFAKMTTENRVNIREDKVA